MPECFLRLWRRRFTGISRALQRFEPVGGFASEVLAGKAFQGIAKTRYVNDKQITDHYAIVPTGQGFGALRSLSSLGMKVYEVIARRFLSIFLSGSGVPEIFPGAGGGSGAFLCQLSGTDRTGISEGCRSSQKRKKERKKIGKQAQQNRRKWKRRPGEKDRNGQSQPEGSGEPGVYASAGRLKKGMEVPRMHLQSRRARHLRRSVIPPVP